MKHKKISSIKQTSFKKMLKSSMLWASVNFFVVLTFVITLTYLLMGSSEGNIANIMLDNIREKQDRIIQITENIAKLYSDDEFVSTRKLLLQQAMGNDPNVTGILILDKDGKIVETTGNIEAYSGYDFSGRDYYKRLMKEGNTFISDAYVAQIDKKVTVNVVTPIIRNDKIDGMVVTMLSPRIIQNNSLKDVEYYIANKNGDIIFHSSDNIVKFEYNVLDTKIIDNVSKGVTVPLIYKDKIKDRYVLGTVRIDSNHSMYIVVQYYIFGNKVLYTGLGILLAAATALVFLFVVLYSFKFSSIATGYINIFTKEVKKISEGDYEIDLTTKYPYEEVNGVLDIFVKMASRVKSREEELQASNEELIAANDEIKEMLNKISENEKEKKNLYIEIMYTLLNFLEIKDEYTAEHSRAVTDYVGFITEKLNSEYGFKLNSEKLQVASILHDIGKISIEREILNKPSKLTNEEYEIIKTHVINGYHALKDIKDLREEREMIRHHHERYSGGGYPDGLRGDAIPLGARIICVADAFDAMVSDRPYRKGMPVELAVAELIRNKGIQFDPLIVDVFVDTLKHQGLLGNSGEAAG